MKEYPLSKSRIKDGIFCERKLWLKKHNKEVATPFTDFQKYLMNNGIKVGKLAHDLYPAGKVVEGGWFNPETAASETERLINEDTPALFEAAFLNDGLLFLADVAINNGHNDIEIHEVKSSASV